MHVKLRTNFSLVYITPCTFKCPIKITRQSSNSCDAGSHRCADETTARLNCPETRWRTPCRSDLRTASKHTTGIGNVDARSLQIHIDLSGYSSNAATLFGANARALNAGNSK